VSAVNINKIPWLWWCQNQLSYDHKTER